MSVGWAGLVQHSMCVTVHPVSAAEQLVKRQPKRASCSSLRRRWHSAAAGVELHAPGRAGKASCPLHRQQHSTSSPSPRLLCCKDITDGAAELQDCSSRVRPATVVRMPCSHQQTSHWLGLHAGMAGHDVTCAKLHTMAAGCAAPRYVLRTSLKRQLQLLELGQCVIRDTALCG